MGNKCRSGRLSASAFGVSLGIITGLTLLGLAWSGMRWGYGTELVKQWATVYPGLDITWLGGLYGLAWGFLEGFVMGVIWAWIYNLCMCCCRCCRCMSCKNSSCEPNKNISSSNINSQL